LNACKAVTGIFDLRSVNPPLWYFDHRDAQCRRRQ